MVLICRLSVTREGRPWQLLPSWNPKNIAGPVCTALSGVWGKVLTDSIRHIFILPRIQCLLHLQNKAPGYIQLGTNQKSIRSL